MHRVDSFHGQIVSESELDAMFDDCEDAEHNLALEAGISQALTTDSPDSTVFGGIISGLVVSANADPTLVTVALGKARDNQGRRCALASEATVMLSNTGTTTEGEISSAQGNGAAITGSCGSGLYIIASLFLVYDEVLTYQRTDATGTTLYYDIAESFHFDIQISTSFSDPPGSTPGRAALANNKVLLTDLVLTNNGGTMELDSICNSNADWDDKGGNYANLDGRRSDCVALDQIADFPQFQARGFHIREGSTRRALYGFVKQIQSETLAANSPDGASLIGIDAISGSENMFAFSPLDLSAADLRSVVSLIVDEMNKKANKGPDINRGFHDDFIYTPTGANRAFDGGPHWGVGTSGAAAAVPCKLGGTETNAVFGGWVTFTTAAVVGSTVFMEQSYNSAFGHIYPYALYTGHGARFRVRLLIDVMGDIEGIIAFKDSAGTSEAGLIIESAGPTVKPYVIDPIGGTVKGSSVLTPTTQTVYEFDVAVLVNTCYLTYGATTESAVCAGGNNLGTNLFGVYVQIKSTSGAACEFSIDVIDINHIEAR